MQWCQLGYVVNSLPIVELMGNVPIVYNDNVDELFTVVSMVVFASLDVASTVASVLLVLVKCIRLC